MVVVVFSDVLQTTVVGVFLAAAVVVVAPVVEPEGASDSTVSSTDSSQS